MVDEPPPFCDVLVIGGGPAGIAAALEASERGLAVILVDQRSAPGGAIHRPAAGSDAPGPGLSSSLRDQWRRLYRGWRAGGFRALMEHVFLGIEADGLALLDDRARGRIVAIRSRSVILALGATEHVRPRPNWQMRGVMTAGGLQVLAKALGAAPPGRTLIAGNGPLPIALAAQLTAYGNPPVAVVESGDPVRNLAAAGALARHPRLFVEAAGYLTRVAAAGVAWRRATALTAIERQGAGIIATLVDRHGRTDRIAVDRIALHDGLQRNDVGLPPEMLDTAAAGPLVLKAGDCRETLGALAAETDGRRAARRAHGLLTERTVQTDDLDRQLARERDAQAILRRMFAPVNRADAPEHLPDETTVCRCEGGTLGDVRRLKVRAGGMSPREMKLVGRFGMGACQGRFCARTVLDMLAQPANEPEGVDRLVGIRWPLRPVSVSAFIAGGRSTAMGEAHPEAFPAPSRHRRPDVGEPPSEIDNV